MEINRILLNLTMIFIVIVLVLDFSSYFVQSSPVSLANRGDVLRIHNSVSGNEKDFPDFEFPEIQQGIRRRRFAFPIDIQNTQCPPGEKLHASGLTCVPDTAYEDDY